MEKKNAYGKLTGVGVGPGDPELMTLKAVRMIREAAVISFPGRSPGESLAYRIAAEAVPEIEGRQLLPLSLPMTRDRRVLAEGHRRAADRLEDELLAGRDTIFLTLGDPAFYSTYSYLAEIVRKDGFDTASVCGVPSFCSAAAALNCPLSVGRESVRILSSFPEEGSLQDDCLIFLKAGKHAGRLRELLRQAGYEGQMVTDLGMPGETIYRSGDLVPDQTGYFSLMIAKKLPDAGGAAGFEGKDGDRDECRE